MNLLSVMDFSVFLRMFFRPLPVENGLVEEVSPGAVDLPVFAEVSLAPHAELFHYRGADPSASTFVGALSRLWIDASQEFRVSHRQYQRRKERSPSSHRRRRGCFGPISSREW